MADIHYIALVESGPEGASVYFPDLPGCTSAGRDLDDAIANAKEALAGHVALMRADGDVIPPPRSLEAIRGDADYRDDLAEVIVAAIPLEAAALHPSPLAAE